MILCDLCGETSVCTPKEIEGREFDICERCWQPVQEKLKGKGRVKNSSGELEELEEYVESEV